jgi:hypothetical protein
VRGTRRSLRPCQAWFSLGYADSGASAITAFVRLRLRVLERLGSVLGFSPEGRSVRVWVRGMPGGDETEVLAGTITEVREEGAVLYLREPEGEQRWILAVPHEPGWGLQALWFSFIAVDVFELEGRERLGRWFIRLGSPG